MSLDVAERWVGWAGAVAAAVSLGVVLVGIARGLRRPRGRATGLARKTLRLPVHVLIAILFFGTCLLLWRPLPLLLAPQARAGVLVLGTLLLFPALALALWGRLALGEVYNVSSSTGAQLYADHRLVTQGPFGIVRHPMYLGILLASVGGLLIYRTWTLLFTTVSFLGLVQRARQEERVLAAEFGEEWEEYHRRVPGWIPRVLGSR